jgi:hypothetical protein
MRKKYLLAWSSDLWLRFELGVHVLIPFKMDFFEPRCRISMNNGEHGKYGQELSLKMGRL